MSDYADRQGVVMNVELRKAVKIAAIQKGITLSQLVEDAIRSYLGMKQKEGSK